MFFFKPEALLLSGKCLFLLFWEEQLRNLTNKTTKLLGDTSEEISLVTTSFFFRALYYIMLSMRFFSLSGLGAWLYLVFLFFDKLHEYNVAFHPSRLLRPCTFPASPHTVKCLFTLGDWGCALLNETIIVLTGTE